MKKFFKLVFTICSVVILLVSSDVIAKELDIDCLCNNPADNLCASCNETSLFTICQKSSKDSCISINTNNINNDQNYGFFEIINKEIYLNNSSIDVLNIYSFWSLLEYKIHINGTNKIRELNNFYNEKYSNTNTSEQYSKDFLPITIEGNGTLEIALAHIYTINSNGETEYNGWYYNPSYLVDNDYIIDSKNRKLGYYLCEMPYGCRLEHEPSTKEEIIENFVTYSIADEDSFKFSTNGGIMEASSFPNNILDIDTLLRLNNVPNFGCEEICELHDLDDPRMCISYSYTCMKNREYIEFLLDHNIIVPNIPIINPAQITRDWGEEYIITNMNRSFTETGSYLIGTIQGDLELDTVTTTQTGSIVFESTEEFDSNYHLSVDDITEDITETQENSVQAKTDKTLIKLYDINMLDKDNNIVDMGTGTYTIKVKLSDLLKKYESYQVIYIAEDNSVTLLPAKVEEGYIVFNTTHLSKYGIVGLERTTKSNTGNIITNPKTADSIITYGLILISLSVAIALVTLRIKKIKRLDN